MVPFPQPLVTFLQHESGTEFPSLLKPFQSEELFTPQHFSWKMQTSQMHSIYHALQLWTWHVEKNDMEHIVQTATISCHTKLTNRMQSVLTGWYHTNQTVNRNIYSELTFCCRLSTASVNSRVPFLYLLIMSVTLSWTIVESYTGGTTHKTSQLKLKPHLLQGLT